MLKVRCVAKDRIAISKNEAEILILTANYFNDNSGKDHDRGDTCVWQAGKRLTSKT